MPATMNVNFMTVVHAGSSGMAMSFPDVCKTPAPPAPPIPIPYPNIAQSSDTADGSTSVKVDGNPIMLKTSNFSMSTGDEAGSLNGVVSNKIKGKAEPVNASFDVKIDGKAVFRLTDPMTANGGSAANALAPAEVQAPAVLAPSIIDFCKKMVKTAKDEKAGKQALEDSGVHKNHWEPMKEVCAKMSVVLYVRQTKASCRGEGTDSKRDWIGEGSVPKPHVILNGSTIDKNNKFQQKTQHFFDQLKKIRGGHKAPAKEDGSESATTLSSFVKDQSVDGRGLPRYKDIIAVSEELLASKFQGVIGHPSKTPGLAFPIQAPFRDAQGRQAYRDEEGRRPHRITNDSGVDYSGKWMTADYDLFEVLRYGKGCKRMTGIAFEELREALNCAMKWDGIQHGAQAHWVPEQDHGLSDAQRAAIDFKSMPSEVDGVLNAYNAGKMDGSLRGAKVDTLLNKQVTISKDKDETDPKTGEVKSGDFRKMNVIDENVTAIFGDGAVNIGKRSELVEALLCKECGE